MSLGNIGFAAPRIVYAGNVKNNGNATANCTIYYASTAGQPADESFSVTLAPGNEAAIPGREYTPDGASYTARKNVTRIEVETNGQTFSLEEPFDGVTSPTSSWTFNVSDDKITSGW